LRTAKCETNEQFSSPLPLAGEVGVRGATALLPLANSQM
jgi:hypothetical protein